jgi:hypothetical protein
VTALSVLRKDRRVVDDDVENAFASRDETYLVDHVLIVEQQVFGSAHGALGIVSGHAVRDADAVARHRAMVPWRCGDAGRR